VTGYIGLSISPEIKKRKIAPKSGSEWSKEEMKFFSLEPQDVKSFDDIVKIENFHLSVESKKFLEECTNVPITVASLNTSPPKIQNLDSIGGSFAKKLYMVVKADRSRESAVDDAIAFLLEALGFGKGEWVVRSRRQSTLEMCGYEKDAIADVCVVNMMRSKGIIRLIVVEDKSAKVSDDNTAAVSLDSEAQLMAEGIAATQENHQPGIPIFMLRFLGTRVTFYVAEFTEIAKVVANGEEAENPTNIKRYPSQYGLDLQYPDQLQEIVGCLDRIKQKLLEFQNSS